MTPKSKHSLHVAHHSPGRMRIKIPTAKRNPTALLKIADSFSDVPGVKSVAINPITGSLLIKYDSIRQIAVNKRLTDKISEDYEPPETDLDKTAKNIIREAKFLAEHSRAAKIAVNFLAKLDYEIKIRTNNFVDLEIVLAAGILTGTILEIGLFIATPVWLTVVIFSFNHILHLHQRPLTPKPVALLSPA